eukprot:gnl/TRDRNA2_/TRDRNA2_132760_c0_seq3.p1 gnl/TRDRNA2_/TRDRNA2_132760_c0~~gnl/TRDRNA2_/TRDRNA2_132760_c0_seq3.p1  ORF type:complete len:457 (-),score=131.24 gnl/TRDRNA2_/TRDRNA2_132760_c0_seq3:111-1394(-)
MDSVAPRRLLLTAIVSTACLGSALAKVEIKPMKHDIQQIIAKNFDGVIGKFRDTQVSSLWFFKEDNKADEGFLDEYNKVAGELKGMAKVTAISCTEWGSFCEKQGVTDTPAVMLYPTNPVPAFKYEGKLEQKALAGKIARFIPDQSTKLSGENIDKFLSESVTKPKVILFSNKKSPPTILKALSSETVFQRTVKFGFATEEEGTVAQKFKIKKYPSFMMIRGSKAEIKEAYTGEMNFLAIKDWVNLHSESGMGDKVQGGGAGAAAEESLEESKPWLVQEVPELTAKSHNDICFKGEGLCVIYLKDGEASPAEIDMLTGLSKKFTSQLSDRGAKMKWMWMNLALEGKYKELFAPAQLPSAVVFNPHKRLRFAVLDHGEDNEIKGDAASISNLMDKVMGGDGRFKMVPGQKLPEWAARDAGKKDGKKEL